MWPEKGLSSRISINAIGDLQKGLHSFKYKKDALWDKRDQKSSIVLKMVIPKGSTYYTGTFMGRESIASNKMTFYLPKVTKKKK